MTEVLDFKAFCRGEVVPVVQRVPRVLFLSGVATEAIAAQGSGWDRLWPQALEIADWMCLGVIVFAGGSWMFGQRTQALERLLGGAIGYEIIRHAPDVLEWLKSL